MPHNHLTDSSTRNTHQLSHIGELNTHPLTVKHILVACPKANSHELVYYPTYSSRCPPLGIFFRALSIMSLLILSCQWFPHNNSASSFHESAKTLNWLRLHDIKLNTLVETPDEYTLTSLEYETYVSATIFHPYHSWEITVQLNLTQYTSYVKLHLMALTEQ